MGGTMGNKVTQTLARTFNQLGYVSVRPNFRGVGESAGVHDAGNGELDDLELVVQWMREPASWQALGLEIKQIEKLPLVLAGFSFGSFVCSHLRERLAQAGQVVERLVMVGSAAGKWELALVPASTILIHGELDETIPLKAVFDWARPQELVVQVVPGAKWELALVPASTILIHGELDETIPLKAVFDWASPQELVVQVVPGADHFFHRRLHCIRNIILGEWLGQAAWAQ